MRTLARSRYIVVWATILASVCGAQAQAQVDGETKALGIKAEAFGELLGNFVYATTVTTRCGKFPELTKEAEETTKSYLHTNGRVISRTSDRLNELLKKHPDPKMKEVGPKIWQNVQEKARELEIGAVKDYPDVLACQRILSAIRQGIFDLEVSNSRALDTLMKD